MMDRRAVDEPRIKAPAGVISSAAKIVRRLRCEAGIASRPRTRDSRPRYLPTYILSHIMFNFTQIYRYGLICCCFTMENFASALGAHDSAYVDVAHVEELTSVLPSLRFSRTACYISRK